MPSNILFAKKFLSRGQSKQDEALDCYARAANLFKMAKKWSQVKSGSNLYPV